MAEFFTARNIKATRKQHYCCACNKVIAVGEAAFYFSMKEDGEFWRGHYHIDCRAAEIALNDLHGCRGGDDWIGLSQIDDEDRDWLRAEYPPVAARMLPQTAEA